MKNRHWGVRAKKANLILALIPLPVRKNSHRKVDWRAFWSRYLENPSFQDLVNKSAKRALRRSGFPHTWSDDVRQEALLILSGYIQKRPDLGYDSERGSFPAFIGSIVYRCCFKGVRQFRHTMHQNSLEEWQHPYCLPQGRIDKRIDLQAAIARLDEKSRSIVLEMLANKTVAEIAIDRTCSPRTVYRDFQKAIALLQRQLVDPQSDR